MREPWLNLVRIIARCFLSLVVLFTILAVASSNQVARAEQDGFDEQERYLLQLINSYRTSKSCGPVVHDPTLQQGAERWAKEAPAKDAHSGHPGEVMADMSRSDGHEGAYNALLCPEGKWCWSRSPSHNAIITNCAHTRVGIGHAPTGTRKGNGWTSDWAWVARFEGGPLQASDLTLSPPAPKVGELVEFHFKVYNNRDQPVTFQHIGPQGRRCEGGACWDWDAFAQGVTVGGKQTQDVSVTRSFLEPGRWSLDRITYQDQADNWYDLPSAGFIQAQAFTVGAGPVQNSDLRHSPASVNVGENKNFVLDILNRGKKTAIRVVLTGVACGAYTWRAVSSAMEVESNQARVFSPEVKTFCKGAWEVTGVFVEYLVDTMSAKTFQSYGLSAVALQSGEVLEPLNPNGCGDSGTEPCARHVQFQVGEGPGPTPTPVPVDTTPPVNPNRPAVDHGCGAQDDVWTACNTPSFEWTGAYDPGPVASGIAGYFVYFGEDVNGTSPEFTQGNTYSSSSFPTSTRFLRVKTKDNEGNEADWKTIFAFKYDGTPPSNPVYATEEQGVLDSVWQNKIRVPQFIWGGARDVGSGVKDYYAYYGANPNGTSYSLIDGNRWDPGPLCGEHQVCTGYLRISTRDKVLNTAPWDTLFTLRYDGVPPTGTLAINGGAATTYSAYVILALDATDTINGVVGSGVQDMRLSGDGEAWSDWEPYATRRDWFLPAINQTLQGAYVQFRDVAGNVSDVISDTIWIDFTPPKPASDHYRLTTDVVVAAGGFHTSTNYSLAATAGQPSPPWNAVGDSHVIEAGYWPTTLVNPVHHVLRPREVSAGGKVISSTNYTLMFTVGQPVVGPFAPDEPANTSLGYRLTAGLWGALNALIPTPTPVPVTPTPTPTPTITPTPSPTPPIEYGVLINDDAEYANTTAVTLRLLTVWDTDQVMISNDPDFTDAVWQPYAPAVPWTIARSGNDVITDTVWIKYRDRDGALHGPFSDTIILDPVEPVSQVYSATVGGGLLFKVAKAANASTAMLDPLPIEVTWGGDDVGADIRRYTVQVLDDAEGIWRDWQVQTTATSGVYYGWYGHTYSFRIRAQDNAGNWEAYRTRPDVTVAMPGCEVIGEFDGSGWIDAGDATAVASRWRTSAANPDPDSDSGTPNYEAKYDLNSDGIINIVDITLVTTRWGVTCP